MTRLKNEEKQLEGIGHPETSEQLEPAAARRPIFIHHFLDSNVQWWITQARLHWQNNDPMLSFICSWIAFNHCYGLLWSNRRRTLKGEGKKAVRLYSLSDQLLEVGIFEHVSDSIKIALFIGEQNHGFPEFWKAFS